MQHNKKNKPANIVPFSEQTKNVPTNEQIHANILDLPANLLPTRLRRLLQPTKPTSFLGSSARSQNKQINAKDLLRERFYQAVRT